MFYAAFPLKMLPLYFSDPYFDPLTVSNTSHVLLHTVRTSTLHRFGDMSVNIQGKRRCCMTKISLHSLHIVAVLERKNRIGNRASGLTAFVSHSGEALYYSYLPIF